MVGFPSLGKSELSLLLSSDCSFGGRLWEGIVAGMRTAENSKKPNLPLGVTCLLLTYEEPL